MTADAVLSGGLPLPVVLAGGAGVVIATAAALSGRAAVRPDLPATRWHRPLPAVAMRLLGTPAGHRPAMIVGLCVVAVALITLAVADGPVRGPGVVTIVAAVAVVGGPLVRRCDPAPLVDRRGGGGAPPGAAARPAAAWLAVLSAVALMVDDGRVLAAVLAAHLLAQLAITASLGTAAHVRTDGLLALAVTASQLSPVGADTTGRPAWRNPMIAAAHAELPPATVWLTAVVAALSITGGLVARATTAAPRTLAVFAVVLALAGLVARTGIIRTFFVGALVPLTVAHALLAAGRWLAPLDLLVFVALHAVAVVVLHREAIARHDLRTARALQLPPRIVVLVSVLAGLAATASG